MASPQLKISCYGIGLFLPFILLLAAGLRLWGIHFGLPGLYHADEPIVVNHALHFGSGDFNPHFFNIPPLTSYLLFLYYGVLFFVGKVFGLWHSTAGFAVHFFHDPSLFYLVGRIMLGVFPAVYSVYILTRWLNQIDLSRGFSLLAGLLFAVCFSHVSEAHYIYTDMLLILVCIFFFMVLHRLDLSKGANHFKVGLVIGLSVALKYNGAFLLMPYLWMSYRVSQNRIRATIVCFWAILGMLLAFFLLNPYALIDFQFFIRELREQSSANQGVPFLHHLAYSLAEGMGWPLILLSAIGAVRAFVSKNIKMESVVIFCVSYYLLLWQKGQPFGRYVLPLVPFMIVLAVSGVEFLFIRLKTFRLIWIILIAIIFCGNFIKDILFDRIMTVSDVRTQAAQWIETNIPSGSRIALDGTSFTPRLNFSCGQLADKQSSLQRETLMSSSAESQRIQAKIKNCKNVPAFELYFLTLSPGANPFLFAKPELAWTYEALSENEIHYIVLVRDFNEKSAIKNELGESARLVKVWDPRASSSYSKEPLDGQVITGGPFTWKDLMARSANGYRLELYALVAADATR